MIIFSCPFGWHEIQYSQALGFFSKLMPVCCSILIWTQKRIPGAYSYWTELLSCLANDENHKTSWHGRKYAATPSIQKWQF